MDARGFVERLVASLPETISDPKDTLGEPLPYVALADARLWLEDHALDLAARPARVRSGCEDVMRRFWEFVEREADGADHEGVGWVEDLGEYLGPQTRALLTDAQGWLAPYNGQVGRWAAKP
jgi:hypothetical protein